MFNIRWAFHVFVLANIIRQGETVQLGLVGGSTASEGRVEIFHNGTWGTVCSDDWGYLEGRVVCQQLGFLYVAKYHTSEFGAGSGTIWLDDVKCIGNETDLAECQHTEWGDHDCHHDRHVGVKCTNLATPIRIVDGVSDRAGILQILLSGQWMSIYYRRWNGPDATVACRQLGYDSGTAHSFHSGTVTHTNVSYVLCTGSENILSECQIEIVSLYGGAAVVGAVVCQQGKESFENNMEFRLVSGGSVREGRVEVYHNSLWGTVCYIYETDADLICKNLGYDYGIPADTSVYGNGSGPIWLSLRCSSSVKRLSECIKAWGNTGCEHTQDRGVICAKSDDNLPIRLSDGVNEMSGHVEILVNGEWGPICTYYPNPCGRYCVDRQTVLKDRFISSTVICRQLGYTSGKAMFSSSLRTDGDTSKSIWRTNVGCQRYVNVPQCFSQISRDAYCHGLVNLTCSSESEPVSLPSVAISGGTFGGYGLVEVNQNGLTGNVCDDNWGEKEATVVCRQNGYPSGKALSNLDSTTNFIAMDTVQCDGSEAGLFQCDYDGWGIHNCDLDESAGVVCCGRDDYKNASSVRLVNDNDGRAGLLQVTSGEEWGYVCDSHWGDIHAEIVCQQLGYRSGVAKHGGSMPGDTQDRIVLDMLGPCTGCEVSLLECPHRPWADVQCDYNELAIAICLNSAGEPFSTLSTILIVIIALLLIAMLCMLVYFRRKKLLPKRISQGLRSFNMKIKNRTSERASANENKEKNVNERINDDKNKNERINDDKNMNDDWEVYENEEVNNDWEIYQNEEVNDDDLYMTLEDETKEGKSKMEDYEAPITTK